LKRWAATNGIAALGGRGGFVMIVKQNRREGLFQVPAEVAGQHPQEHVGAHPPCALGRSRSGPSER